MTREADELPPSADPQTQRALARGRERRLDRVRGTSFPRRPGRHSSATSRGWRLDDFSETARRASSDRDRTATLLATRWRMPIASALQVVLGRRVRQGPRAGPIRGRTRPRQTSGGSSSHRPADARDRRDSAPLRGSGGRRRTSLRSRASLRRPSQPPDGTLDGTRASRTGPGRSRAEATTSTRHCRGQKVISRRSSKARLAREHAPRGTL